MAFNKAILPLVFLLSTFVPAYLGAQIQDTSSLTLTLQRATIHDLAKAIERQTGYHIYFDPNQFDTLLFTLSTSKSSLSQVLGSAFYKSNIHFAIDHRKNIFITRDHTIHTAMNTPGSASHLQKKNTEPDFDTVGNRSTNQAVQTLASVTVSAATNVRGTQMGVQKIDIGAIRQVPVVFGEADVLRVVMAMPGVKTVGEASTGLNVRGGSTDQNLILFNEATIYNPAHFFGMFSAINPDMVEEVTLYKSHIPARFGGRLASVLDISGKEGNKSNISGRAGIGPLTSRIAIEGPLLKDKTSFIAGARSTYANWLLKLLPQEYEDSRASFYDFNLRVNHAISKKTELSADAYISRDNFHLNKDTVYAYDNMNFSMKLKHGISKRLSADFAAGADEYKYRISSTSNPVNAYNLSFSINQTFFRGRFNYYVDDRHTLEFGLSSIYYRIKPGRYGPEGDESFVAHDEIEPDRALESALYVNHKFDISSSLSLEAGTRFSLLNYLGPRTVNQYSPGQPKDEETITGTIKYKSGKFINSYGGPEFRISGRVLLTEKYSIKGSFNTTRQYIHMLSNTAAMAPTDIWKLSDPNIRPQTGIQYSLGLYRNIKSNTIETSVEVYYKTIQNYLDYKSGANLIMNHHIETDVISAKGKAYGAEFLVKKTAGKFNGWIAYTYSRILLQQDDPAAGEVINEGKDYPASYDKPHDFAFIGNFRINQRFSISLNASYSTGRPITVPIGRYYYNNSYRTLYGKRNDHRIPNYFRTDVSINVEGNHNVKQKTHNSWTFGVYNVTGRQNPYSVYYVSEGGVINGYKLSIFGSAIPFVTFNIRF